MSYGGLEEPITGWPAAMDPKQLRTTTPVFESPHPGDIGTDVLPTPVDTE